MITLRVIEIGVIGIGLFFCGGVIGWVLGYGSAMSEQKEKVNDQSGKNDR